MTKEKISLHSPKFTSSPAIEDPFWKDFAFPIDFSVIGAPKCGTSWLYHCMDQHPEIFIPGELNFFTVRRYKGKEFYYNLFKNNKQYKSVGDYSNTYMIDDNLPQIFSLMNPDIKIILCCRNPTKRAFSHYLMDVSKGLIDAQKTSFYEALICPQIYSYYDFGLYFKHISRYMKYINKNNILVITLEQINEHPQKTVDKVFQFLGVSRFVPSTSFSDPKNTWEKRRILSMSIARSDYALKILGILKSALSDKIYKRLKWYPLQLAKRTKPTISKELASMLSELYYPENKKLEKFLSEDLSSWNKI